MDHLQYPYTQNETSQVSSRDTWPFNTGLIGCFETLEYGCFLLIRQRKGESGSLFWTCQQAPRFCKRRGFAQSLDIFPIYDNITHTWPTQHNFQFTATCFGRTPPSSVRLETNIKNSPAYNTLQQKYILYCSDFYSWMQNCNFHKTWLKFYIPIYKYWSSFRHRIHYTSITHVLLSLYSVYEAACSKRRYGIDVYVTCAYVGFINEKCTKWIRLEQSKGHQCLVHGVGNKNIVLRLHFYPSVEFVHAPDCILLYCTQWGPNVLGLISFFKSERHTFFYSK
jgi:hypothetical protein